MFMCTFFNFQKDHFMNFVYANACDMAVIDMQSIISLVA